MNDQQLQSQPQSYLQQQQPHPNLTSFKSDNDENDSAIEEKSSFSNSGVDALKAFISSLGLHPYGLHTKIELERKRERGRENTHKTETIQFYR